MSKVNDTLLQLIEECKAGKKHKDKHGWLKNSVFGAIRDDLQADERGEVGEKFIANLLEQLGYEVSGTNRTDRAKKQWDLFVKSKRQGLEAIKLEVKTATLGFNTSNFQHENLEKERGYDGIIFLDIGPNQLYLSCHAKTSIKWPSLHRRANSTFYKWDVPLKKLQGTNELNTLNDFEHHYNEMLGIINIDRRNQLQEGSF